MSAPKRLLIRDYQCSAAVTYLYRQFFDYELPVCLTIFNLATRIPSTASTFNS